VVEVNWAEVALRECDGVIDCPGEIALVAFTLGKSRWGNHPGKGHEKTSGLRLREVFGSIAR